MKDLLARMRSNPAGDWTMADVEAACRQAGAAVMPPRGGGSHFKVLHPTRRDVFIIPARRPIKPIYIRKLAHFLGQTGADDADH